MIPETTMVRNVTPQKSWLVKCRRWIAVKAQALTMISRFKFDFFSIREYIYIPIRSKIRPMGALYQKIDGKRKQVYTSFEKALLSM